jgi:hypothetical protein
VVLSQRQRVWLDRTIGTLEGLRRGLSEPYPFALFERWMDSDVPWAGQIFREVTQNIFRRTPSSGVKATPHAELPDRAKTPSL